MSRYRWSVAILVAAAVVLLAPAAARADNTPPVANAGPDQTVSPGAVVTLDGSASYDPDGDSITFHWTQVAGTPVTLDNVDAVRPSFTAPGPHGGETLTFQLTVTDSNGASSFDTVGVAVTFVNRPPDCSRTAASPSVLSPADRTLRPVSVVGVSDPDGDALSVAVASVFQDEPLTGAEDHTSPDARLEPSGIADIRAERRNSGDGRVYHLFFTASDAYGGSCSGEVKVSVPRKDRGAAVDEGPLYNSTG
jgi:chitinase